MAARRRPSRRHSIRWRIRPLVSLRPHRKRASWAILLLPERALQDDRVSDRPGAAALKSFGKVGWGKTRIASEKKVGTLDGHDGLLIYQREGRLETLAMYLHKGGSMDIIFSFSLHECVGAFAGSSEGS